MRARDPMLMLLALFGVAYASTSHEWTAALSAPPEALATGMVLLVLAAVLRRAVPRNDERSASQKPVGTRTSVVLRHSTKVSAREHFVLPANVQK